MTGGGREPATQLSERGRSGSSENLTNSAFIGVFVVLQGDLPQELSLIPGGPLKADALRNAVWTVANDMAAGGNEFPHIVELLRRHPPRLT